MAVLPVTAAGLSGLTALPPVELIPPDAQLLTQGVQDIPGMDGLGAVAGAQPSTSSFADMLGHMVSEVNDKQVAAADAVNALQSGQNGSLHQAMISMEEASISFQLMVEVRNKLLDSYQELMRMQI